MGPPPHLSRAQAAAAAEEVVVVAAAGAAAAGALGEVAAVALFWDLLLLGVWVWSRALTWMPPGHGAAAAAAVAEPSARCCLPSTRATTRGLTATTLWARGAACWPHSS